MKISECMTRDVRTVSPDMTIKEAAQIMFEIDAGIVPVGEDDRLVGMLSDRDIAMRAVCKGKNPDTPVRDVMTDDMKYCYDDESVEHVVRNMGDIQVRRLPVLNRDKRLVGIVALSDLAACADPDLMNEVLGDITRPSAQHNQTGAHF